MSNFISLLVTNKDGSFYTDLVATAQIRQIRIFDCKHNFASAHYASDSFDINKKYFIEILLKNDSSYSLNAPGKYVREFMKNLSAENILFEFDESMFK